MTTATPWGTTPSAGHEIHGQHIIWNDSGKTIAVTYTDASDAALIVRAVNSHAALVEALELISEHDEFTGAMPDNLPLWQAYALLNALRLKARAALQLAKESS